MVLALKKFMKKIFTYLVVFSLLIMPGVLHAESFPGLPMGIYGTVTVLGSNADVGTVVKIYTDSGLGTLVDSITVTTAGTYGGNTADVGKLTVQQSDSTSGFVFTVTLPSRTEYIVPSAKITYSSSGSSGACSSTTSAIVYAQGAVCKYNIALNTGATPNVVTGLTATQASSTTMNLSWTAGDGATSYKIYRNTADSGWSGLTAIATGEAGTTYGDSNLTANTLYYYKVKSTSATGDSDFNATAASDTTFIIVPTGLSGSAASTTAVNLSWTAVSGATSYRVYRDSSLVGSPTSASYSDSGLAANTTYSYTVAAVNADGTTAQCSAVSVKTNSGGGGGGGGGGSSSSTPSTYQTYTPPATATTTTETVPTQTTTTQETPTVTTPTTATTADNSANWSDPALVKATIAQERALVTTVDSKLSNRLKGNILLQVESHGEGWYVNPSDSQKYYLGRPADAYSIMRFLSVGITNKDLDRLQTSKSFARQHSGKIFIQVEEHGEAYYVDFEGNVTYMKDGAAAYDIMRGKGLGISNSDIRKIGVGDTTELETALGQQTQTTPTPAPTTPTTPKQTVTSDYTFTSFLSNGSKGEEVRELQLLLQSLGYFPADQEATGLYGNMTEQAVKDFQAANNIETAGYVGPGTRQALNSQN
jgi:hypothetical protein